MPASVRSIPASRCAAPETPAVTDREKTAPGGGAFDALLGRLVQVPKAEVQAEEAKYKAMRERLKEKGEQKGRRKAAD